MALTENEYKQKLVLALGGEGSLSSRQLELAWKEHADKSPLALRYNYALIEAINFKLGGSWQDYDVRTASGNDLKLEQPFRHLVQLAQRAQAQIEYIVMGPPPPAAVYGAAVGEMIERVPVPTPYAYLPDPNASQYVGDPLAAARSYPTEYELQVLADELAAEGSE